MSVCLAWQSIKRAKTDSLEPEITDSLFANRPGYPLSDHLTREAGSLPYPYLRRKVFHASSSESGSTGLGCGFPRRRRLGLGGEQGLTEASSVNPTTSGRRVTASFERQSA